MSEIKYQEYRVSDLFSYVSGNIIYNKSYCNAHKGEFPVYTATIGNPIGRINSYEYSGQYLSWTVDGVNSGTVEILEGKFNTGNGRGLLIPKVKGIYLKYFRYILEPIFKNEASGRGRGGTSHCKWSHIQCKNIKVPILNENNFDYTYQKELADKYDIIEEQKQALLAKVRELEEISVVLPQKDDIKWAYPLITTLFYPQGGSSEYTKKWVSENVGEIPLYSGATSGVYANVNRADYDGEFLTWVKDGLAGYIMYHNERFCITCHRGVLIPTDKCKNIDLRYIRYVLEPIFRAKKKGREGHLGKNEYTSLSPSDIKAMKDTIPVPIREDGTYDIDKQKELANKYEQVEEIKQSLINRIIELTEIVVV